MYAVIEFIVLAYYNPLTQVFGYFFIGIPDWLHSSQQRQHPEMEQNKKKFSLTSRHCLYPSSKIYTAQMGSDLDNTSLSLSPSQETWSCTFETQSTAAMYQQSNGSMQNYFPFFTNDKNRQNQGQNLSSVFIFVFCAFYEMMYSY